MTMALLAAAIAFLSALENWGDFEEGRFMLAFSQEAITLLRIFLACVDVLVDCVLSVPRRASADKRRCSGSPRMKVSSVGCCPWICLKISGAEFSKREATWTTR